MYYFLFYFIMGEKDYLIFQLNFVISKYEYSVGHNKISDLNTFLKKKKKKK